MNKKLGKVLTSIVVASTLLVGSSLPVLAAANNQTAPSTQQQTITSKILSSPEHIKKVKEAQKNITIPTLKPGEVVQKTMYVDNLKYVYTFGNNAIKTPLSSLSKNNTIALATSQGGCYAQEDCYDALGFWLFAVGYHNDFSYNGTTVNAGTPYFTSSKAVWLITFTLTSENMVANNFGSYASSSGTAAVHELDIEVGSLFNYDFYGHATMYSDGSSSASVS